MGRVRTAARKVAAAVVRPAPGATAVTIAQGRVLFSLTDGHVSVEAAGAIFFAPYYGTRPAGTDIVDVLFVDGSPRILGVLHGLPPLTP